MRKHCVFLAGIFLVSVFSAMKLVMVSGCVLAVSLYKAERTCKTVCIKIKNLVLSALQRL